MKAVKECHLNMLLGGARDMNRSAMAHAHMASHQAGAKEEFIIGFVRAAGAWAFYAVTEGIKHFFSGNNKKDDKDKNDKDARHYYNSGAMSSISPMGGYSF